MDLPTRIDLFNVGADEVLARSLARPPSQRLNPDEVFTDGSDINIVIAAASAMADENNRQLGLRIAALFLDTAQGADLDRLVADRFGPEVARKSASPAVVTLSLSRATGPLAALTLAEGTKVKTSTGTEFTTRFSASFSAAQLGPVTVEAQAVQAGIAGNVGAGTLAEFAVPPSDTHLIVTNLEPAAGGDDDETDARFRERARAFFLAARRGIKAAIEFGALTVAGVRQATAVEDTNIDGTPSGTGIVYIADAQGQGNSVLVNAVTAALLEYRAMGIYINVLAANPVYVPIEYRLRFEAGVDSTQAFASIQLATLAVVNNLRPNQTLEVSLLFAQARSVPGVIVLEDAIVTPVGDLVPEPGQVIRTRQDLVTVQ